MLLKIKYLAILLFYFFCTIQKTLAQPNQLSFEHVSSEEGLGNTTIHCLTKDHFGFMWFGSGGGLYRYDGNELKVFQNDKKNKYSIVDDRINVILETSDKRLVLGSWDKGLSFFDFNTETFTNFTKESKSNPLKSNQVTALVEDNNQNLWLGLSDGGGLNLYNKKNKSIYKLYRFKRK